MNFAILVYNCKETVQPRPSCNSVPRFRVSRPRSKFHEFLRKNILKVFLFFEAYTATRKILLPGGPEASQIYSICVYL